MSNSAICFVATELYPFTRGGIGVLCANLMEQSASPDVATTFLYVGDQPISSEQFAFHYPHARLVVAEHEARRNPRYEELPGWAFSSGEWHRRSFVAMLAIEQMLDDGVDLDWIEFQDFGGLGAVTLAERVLNSAFRPLRVAVRIHGAESTIRLSEPRFGQLEHLWTMDLERSALLQADLVVSHAAGVEDYVRAALGPHGRNVGQTWIVQTPPILGNRFLRFSQSIGTDQERPKQRNIVFASKIQDIKRPKVFVRGCAEYFSAAGADRPGDAIIMTACDEGAWASLTASLTEYQLERFRLLPLTGTEDRMRVFAESVVVIPGPYESLCLLAFEAAACGAILVLNGNNPAFDDDSVWVDGVNAIKFDGTSKGLASALTVATSQNTPVRQRPYRPPAPSTPYWQEDRQVAGGGEHVVNGTVGVVVTNYNLGEYLGSAIRSVVSGTRAPDKLMIVDDASSAVGERAFIEEAVAYAQEGGVEASAVFLAANRGLAAARNEALDCLDTDYVIFLDADDLLEPGFIKRAADALDAHHDVDVVVPQVAIFADDSELFEAPARDYAVFLADTHLGSLVANRLSSATNMARLDVIEHHRFSEGMSAYEDWDLWVRLQVAGSRFVADYRIGLWYRQRSDSMAATARGGSGHAVNLDRLRSHAQAAGGLVEPCVLTDAFSLGPPEIPSAEVLAAHGYLSHAESLAMRAEIERLAAVEEEFRAILGRKAVTMAMRVADARHRLKGRNHESTG